MIKIALLGDIHGNLPALEAVLNHAKAHGVDNFINVGNSLGFDIFPDETIQRLQIENVVSILGQFDQRVLKAKAKLEKLKKSPAPDQWLFLNWIYNNLSGNSLHYLNSLKRSSLLTIEKKRILLTSQPPKLIKLNPDLPPELATDFAFKAAADIIIFSQQQFPYIKRFNHVRLINTGAVGYAFDTDIWACYTVLKFSMGFIKVYPYRIKYNITQRQTKIWPAGIAKPLSTISCPEITAAAESETAISTERSILSLADKDTKDDSARVDQLLLNCSSCRHQIYHARQVTRLALDLFDQLQPLHKLAKTERRLLQYGSMLHDIGWLNGRNSHHKVAFNIIVNTNTLPFPKRERYIIALLALYHRKITPSAQHMHFASLEPEDRKMVSYLIAILRVADGFDNSHQNLINHLLCDITSQAIKIIYTAKQPAEAECLTVSIKGQFFEEIFGRKLVTEWKTA
jgi:predicted phosphodiesterase